MYERRARHFILAGIFLSLSLDTYDAARILPFIALAYLLYETLRNPAFLRTNYGNLALFGLSALLAFSPLGWYVLHNWDAYTGRASFTWIGSQIERAGSILPLLSNIGSAFGMFNFRSNGNDFFVIEPLLDVPVSVLFVLGMVYSVSQWRRPGHFLLLTMLLFTLLVGIASSPNGNRCLGAVVPATAFSAIFLVRVWHWLADAYPGHRTGSSLLWWAYCFTPGTPAIWGLTGGSNGDSIQR